MVGQEILQYLQAQTRQLIRTKSCKRYTGLPFNVAAFSPIAEANWR